jgi:hypothetical protein
MAAGSLALLTALLVLFGAYDQLSGTSGLLTAPEAIWELSLGIYLIVRGFRADAGLFTRMRLDTGAEDFSFRVGETPASAEASS